MEVYGLIFVILFLFVVPAILLFQMWRVIDHVRDENKTLSDLLHKLEPLIKKLSDGAESLKVSDDVPTATVSELPEEDFAEPISAAKTIPAETTPPLMSKDPVPVTELYAEPVSMQQPEKPRRRNMEKIIGENLMSKIGILALIIGIGFFVKFAIDNNWINEVGRTVIGLVAGIGLWGLAYPLRDRYRNFSSVLAGGGFAVCFVTVAVAYNFYDLFRSGTAFAVFVALTAAMIGIALRFDRRELAMTGFVGGFVAPFLAVGDTSSCFMLFAYITVLNVGIFIVTLKRNWWELAAVACILTWIVTLIYTITGTLTAADSAIMLCFATLFVVLFSIPLATVLSRDTRRSALSLFMLTSAAVNFFAYLLFGLEFIADVPALCNVRGIVPFVAGSINLLLFYKFYRGRTDRLMQNLLLGATVVFATLVIPIQFSNPSVIVVGFAVLMFTFAGVCGMTSRSLFGIAAIVLACIDIPTLTTVHPISFHSSNSYSAVWTYGLTGICYIAVAGIISRKWRVFLKFGRSERRAAYCVSLWLGVAMMCAAVYLFTGIAAGRMEAWTSVMTSAMLALLLVSLYGRNSGYAACWFPAVGALLFAICCGAYRQPAPVNEILQWTGALLFVAVMSIQGNRLFRHPRLVRPFSRKGFAVYFSLSASVFIVTAIELMLRTADLSRYYSAGFSVGLIICGTLLMAAGMRYRSRAVRMTGISIFGLLLLKLVAYDIWELPMIGRIIVFTLLGAVMLAMSFLYQRLRKSIFGDDSR